MAYNKKYAELGESVIDYVNNREDAIDQGFNDVATQLAQKVDKDGNEQVTMSMLSAEIKQALNDGEWNVNINTSDIEDGAITIEKLNFTKKSSNEFDKSSVIKGFTIPPGEGEVSENAQFSVTPFIRVNQGDTFCSLGINRFSFYKSDNSFLIASSVSSSVPQIINVPADAVTMRLSVQLLRLDTAQYNKGTELLPYEKYYYHIDERFIPNVLGDILVEENELWKDV